MLCESCKKNEATNVCERVRDGKKQTAYYCPSCYHRLFLSENKAYAVCPVCKTTVADYKKHGLVGCAKCYKYLYDELKDDIAYMQGTEPHCGKGATPYVSVYAGATEKERF